MPLEIHIAYSCNRNIVLEIVLNWFSLFCVLLVRASKCLETILKICTSIFGLHLFFFHMKKYMSTATGQRESAWLKDKAVTSTEQCPIMKWTKGCRVPGMSAQESGIVTWWWMTSCEAPAKIVTLYLNSTPIRQWFLSEYWQPWSIGRTWYYC